jgi:hypothetical protein
MNGEAILTVALNIVALIFAEKHNVSCNPEPIK